MRCIALLVVALAQSVGAASIAIDVGHYFEEPGVISARGRPEFEFNRTLAHEIEGVLKTRGYTTKLIGDDGKMKELWRRPREANGSDLFISVHHDSAREKYLLPWVHEGDEHRYSDMFSGFSLFVSRENSGWRKGLRCASAIGAALVKAGFKPSLYHADPVFGENRPFADRDNSVHYFEHLAVLRSATMPALLFEAGVIVNREEEVKMSDKQVQQGIAASVADGIEACLKKDEGGRRKDEGKTNSKNGTAYAE
jgi:N-acetylmuramoyl-L-alanine amidase